MSAEPCLLALTPPRSSPVTLAGQAQMLAALAHTRRPARRGIALEIAGKGGHVRFLARAANPAASPATSRRGPSTYCPTRLTISRAYGPGR